MKIIAKNKLFTFFLVALTIFCATFFILFPSTSSNAVADGISICLNVLIPSLFPFMVVSVFLTESGLINFVFKIPSKMLSRFTKVDPFYCNLFFIGMIGGYPSAAKNISVCLKNKQIDVKTAETLLCFCTNAGPSFLISAVGCKMFLSSSIGVILYVSSLLSSITLMLIYGPKITSNPYLTAQNQGVGVSKTLISSVKSCCNSMLMICALVLLFSAVIVIFEGPTGDIPIIKTILCGFFEVTKGCILASAKINLSSILITSALCSFGGLCVIMQIKAICSEYNISLSKFMISRFINVAINFIYTILLVIFIPVKIEETFVNNSPSAQPEVFNTPIPAFILLICCIVFPICLSGRKKL